MKLLWKLLLKLSITAAEKLNGCEVVQVDIHLASGNKLMIMDRDELGKLKACTKLLAEWSPENIAELEKQIDRLNREGKNG